MSTAAVTPTPSLPPELVATQHVFQLTTGYIVSTAVHVVVRLGIADRLANGPRPVADLAREAGVNEDALYRVLRLTSSVGLFEEGGPREFKTNLASSLLRRSVPGSIYDMVLWM